MGIFLTMIFLTMLGMTSAGKVFGLKDLSALAAREPTTPTKAFQAFSGTGYTTANANAIATSQPAVANSQKKTILTPVVNTLAKVVVKVAPEKAIGTALASATTAVSQCTRSQAATSACRSTIEVFAAGVDLVGPKATEVVTRNTINSVTSKINIAIPLIGAGIVLGTTAPVVVSELKKGEIGAAALTTATSAADWVASSKAFAACASASIPYTAPTGPIMAPILSFGAGLCCSVGVSRLIHDISGGIRSSITSTSPPVTATDAVTTAETAATASAVSAATAAIAAETAIAETTILKAYRGTLLYSTARQWEQLTEDVITGVDRARAVIRHIQTSRTHGNTFQPTREQSDVLHTMRFRLGLDKIKWNTHWMELVGDGEILFAGHDRSVYTNQMDRAHKIVDHMLATGKRILRTMDGHGRFLYCFLLALKDKIPANDTIDNYDIDLYDIDHGVNLWHREFMTQENVVTRPGNILNNGAFPDTDLQLQHMQKTTFVYLNFCGIGSDLMNILKIQNVLSWFTTKSVSAAISWSVRGVVKPNTNLWKFAEWIAEHGSHIAHRGNYYTYGFF